MSSPIAKGHIMNRQFTESNRKTLGAKGYLTDKDLCYLFPYRYCNYSILTPPLKEYAGEFIAVRGYLTRANIKNVNYRSFIQGFMQTEFGRFNFTFFGRKPMEEVVARLLEKDIIVCGKLKYDDKYGPSISNPEKICDASENPGWFLKYSEFGSGKTKIEEDTLVQGIQEVQRTALLPETIPSWILEETGLLRRRDSLLELTSPTHPARLMNAVQRQVFEDMLYFACRIERDKRKLSPGSQYNVKTCRTPEDIIANLTYRLTEDQMKVYTTLVEKMKNGERLSHLVQGDVGYGKSITAFLLMFAMADSGYQSIIMAPTILLAEQHYEQLEKLAGKYGYKVAFLHGSLNKSTKEKLKKGIASGEYQLIVSTHAATSRDVHFHKLALVIIDEEQRFGVRQRQMLREKAAEGVHSISMTATPIPRTIAASIYGNMNILEIKTAPKNKIPVQTAVVSNDMPALRFLKKKIEEGEQGYVICPLINDENYTKNVRVQTVEEVAKRYRDYLGVPVAVATGKQKKSEALKILKGFRKGEIKVLVGTTVLEVGVSVKNANVIIVEDAWMFGILQLHQLRGRVGRGSKQGYCILQSSRPSEALQFLTTTTDGFKVSEFDEKMRGSGNLLGEEQSGRNKYIDYAIRFPKMYATACRYAEKMVDTGEDTTLIEETESRSEKACLNFWKLYVYDRSGIEWESFLPKLG